MNQGGMNFFMHFQELYAILLLMKYSELVIKCITYLHFCFITYYRNDSL